ncbi:MAG TPA: hypothetical protein VNA25_05250, partial [Phycisphaerae bacterium]|nr:hypothetical protein [Phycisphaerae bacterium]
RFLAHKRLKKKDIRATFAGKLTDVQASIRSLAENMHRVELNHADAAKAVTTLYKAFGRDERRVARETGMSLTKVRRYIYVKERASQHALNLLKTKKVTLLDVKRALDAAQGNIGKANRLLDRMIVMRGQAKKRLSEYAEAHPNASVNEIVREAKRPGVRERLSLDLTEPVRQALGKAERALKMKAEEIAAQALEEWLEAKGFVA